MKYFRVSFSQVLSVAAAGAFLFSHGAIAECVIAEEIKTLDPVEVGYCESDAVFVAKVQSRMETTRAFRAEGSEHTQHFRTETSSAQVGEVFKGTLADKATLTAELYDKGETYSFSMGKEYLVFAKKLPGENRFAGVGAKCSVQPTLPLSEAKEVLKRLQAIKSGKEKIDCDPLRPKE